MLSYEAIVHKLITPEKAAELFSPDFRGENRIVFTNGCFDVLHRGHVYYLAKAREMGDLLVIGLNSDTSVSKLKGKGRPVNGQKARAEVLGALGMVDYIILFEEDTPLNLISTVRPDLLVKGGDYQVEKIVGYKEVTSRGGEVITIPILEGYSSSSIIERG
ncbi:MAG: D-glycero-beta-D-manno-heptose 1-phosphate adenylyltransferase [Bacteroidetes bacterium]|nr:D-glycero-beta-D-manno-heptose 1-phosphate adenylyltransferase [Bacteroidota bacterium]